MEGSNRVEPLMKSEDELKIRPLSVMAGAQSKKHRRLINRSRKRVKEEKCHSPLKTKAFVDSWINLQLL